VKNKSKLVNGFIISTFVSLYLMVSVISTIHVIEFFELSNPSWLAISLAVAFEVGAAASLASLIAMEKMNKSLVWFLFILLTAMQAMGNTYYAFVNLGDYTSWSELFGIIEEEEIFQKRILSIVSGAILPIVALGFIKSLVDYIKPEDDKIETKEDAEEDLEEIDSSEKDEEEDLENLEEYQDISEPLIYDSHWNDISIPDKDLSVDNLPEQVDEGDLVDAGQSDSETSEDEKKPISEDKIEIVNVNSNKNNLRRVEMPTDPDINPTRL